MSEIINGEGSINTFVSTDYEWYSKSYSFLNDENGRELDVNGGQFSGTPEGVFDGEDTTLWNPTNIVGNRVNFDATNRPRTGSQSAYFNRVFVGDICQFDKGSDIDLSNYSAITFYVNVNNNWVSGDSFELYGWDTGTNSKVGDSIKLEDYFNFLDYDDWLELLIPLEAMGLESSTIDAFRIECISTAGANAPRWFLDDWDIQETTEIFEYTAEPATGKLFEMNGIELNIVNNGTREESSYWNQFFGITKLSNGLVFQRFSGSTIVFNFTTTCYRDWPSVGFEETMASQGSDNGNTSTTRQYVRRFDQPIPLRASDLDKLTITVEDNLSTLLSFRANIFGRERDE